MDIQKLKQVQQKRKQMAAQTLRRQKLREAEQKRRQEQQQKARQTALQIHRAKNQSSRQRFIRSGSLSKASERKSSVTKVSSVSRKSVQKWEIPSKAQSTQRKTDQNRTQPFEPKRLSQQPELKGLVLQCEKQPQTIFDFWQHNNVQASQFNDSLCEQKVELKKKPNADKKQEKPRCKAVSSELAMKGSIAELQCLIGFNDTTQSYIRDKRWLANIEKQMPQTKNKLRLLKQQLVGKESPLTNLFDILSDNSKTLERMICEDSLNQPLVKKLQPRLQAPPSLRERGSVDKKEVKEKENRSLRKEEQVLLEDSLFSNPVQAKKPSKVEEQKEDQGLDQSRASYVSQRAKQKLALINNKRKKEKPEEVKGYAAYARSKERPREKSPEKTQATESMLERQLEGLNEKLRQAK